MEKCWSSFSVLKKLVGLLGFQANKQIFKNIPNSNSGMYRKMWVIVSLSETKWLVVWAFKPATKNENHPKFKTQECMENVGNWFLSLKQNGWSFGPWLIIESQNICQIDCQQGSRMPEYMPDRLSAGSRMPEYMPDSLFSLDNHVSSVLLALALLALAKSEPEVMEKRLQFAWFMWYLVTGCQA